MPSPSPAQAAPVFRAPAAGGEGPGSLEAAVARRCEVRTEGARVAEEVRRQSDAVRGHLVEEVRLQARALEGRQQLDGLAGSARVLVGWLRHEDVLERDHVG